jgi:hypothetical protein
MKAQQATKPSNPGMSAEDNASQVGAMANQAEYEHQLSARLQQNAQAEQQRQDQADQNDREFNPADYQDYAEGGEVEDQNDDHTTDYQLSGQDKQNVEDYLNADKQRDAKMQALQDVITEGKSKSMVDPSYQPPVNLPSGYDMASKVTDNPYLGAGLATAYDLAPAALDVMPGMAGTVENVGSKNFVGHAPTVTGAPAEMSAIREQLSGMSPYDKKAQLLNARLNSLKDMLGRIGR